MAWPRTRRTHEPAAVQPPVSSAPSLVEYRFAVAHAHAGRSYRAGDIIEIDEATAERIRRYAGADALVRVHGAG